jgi:hypothetical protein
MQKARDRSLAAMENVLQCRAMMKAREQTVIRIVQPQVRCLVLKYGPSVSGTNTPYKRLKSKLTCSIPVTGGRDSAVGIATRYDLDGPGIESR